MLPEISLETCRQSPALIPRKHAMALLPSLRDDRALLHCQERKKTSNPFVPSLCRVDDGLKRFNTRARFAKNYGRVSFKLRLSKIVGGVYSEKPATSTIFRVLAGYLFSGTCIPSTGHCTVFGSLGLAKQRTLRAHSRANGCGAAIPVCREPGDAIFNCEKLGRNQSEQEAWLSRQRRWRSVRRSV